MARSNFSTAIKVACIKRATVNGVLICELCRLPAKKGDIDHINPDGLTGKPTLENARFVCKPCHKAKTAVDVAAIAKAKRREARHIGAKSPKGTIPASVKPAAPVKDRIGRLPPRAMFEERNDI